MQVVEDGKAFEGIYLFFGVPAGGRSPIHVLGNTLDAADFTALPPAGGPRLR